MTSLEGLSSPDNDLAKEVYAYFGACMYFAQVFETGLINILTVLETAAAEPASQHDHEAIFDSLYAKHEALTFGNLLRALSTYSLIPRELMDEAKALKVERDHLAHRFFRDHDLDLVTVAGCHTMIEALECRRVKFGDLDQKISALLDKAYETAGHSDQLKMSMEKIQLEMLNEARDRYCSAPTER